jgi:hypothetical protein
MEMLPVELVQLKDVTVSEWVQICGEDGELPNAYLQNPRIWSLE